MTIGYQVSVNGGTSASLTFDANGNMTSDGTNSYSWDAENRMIKITYPGSGNNSRFVYEGLSRNAAIVETTAGSVTSTKLFVWCGNNRFEARNSIGTLLAQYFADGELVNGSSYFCTKDHLGSVREISDASGVTQEQYSFSPFGEISRGFSLQTISSDFQYAGYYTHQASGLNLSRTRAYHSRLAIWMNRDPIKEDGGLNLYRYCEQDPINFFDSIGLLESHTYTPTNFAQEAGIDPTLIIKNGCVGIVQAYQGQSSKDKGVYPERYGDTHCFKTQAEAEKYKCCPGSKPKVFFAKQGPWSMGGPIAIPFSNEISTLSMSGNSGNFNYTVDLPNSGQYVWANCSAAQAANPVEKGNQSVYVDDKPAN